MDDVKAAAPQGPLMAAELVLRETRLDLALDDQAPALGVVNDDVREARSLGLEIRVRWIAGQTLLHDHETTGIRWGGDADALQERVQQHAVLVEAHGQGVRQPILRLVVLIEEVPHPEGR